MVIARAVAVLVIGYLFVSFAAGEELSGRAVSIADGDTFTLFMPDKQQVKIRLAEIDAPEHGQPYGDRSRQHLAELVFQ